MLEQKPDKVVETLDEVADMLGEFIDVMPPELLNWLPPPMSHKSSNLVDPQSEAAH